LSVAYDNVIPFPLNENLTINEVEDQGELNLDIPRNRLDYIEYMRDMLDPDDYISFLEAVACYEFFQAAEEDIQAVVCGYCALKI
jgi:hypothetical protein